MSLPLATCAVVGLMVVVGGENAATHDAARMEGVWRFDMVEVDGVKRPELPFATNKVIILKDGRFVIMQGTQFTRGVMKLDATQTPKQYDSTITSGAAKGLTFPCIYELESDSFKLCGPYAGGNRPSEFVTGPGSGLVMQVLKREKQSVHDAMLEATQKELAGAWQAASCIRDGKPESEEAVKQMKLAFEIDGKTTENDAGGLSHAANTRIDAVADPLAIDITDTDGRMKDQTSLGIAMIDGDALTLCRAAPGKPRPTEFKSDPGSGQTLATYRRAAAEKK